jgi:hypothetical protein
LVDSTGNEISSNLQKSYIINAGKVDANGVVLLEQETQTLIISLANNQLSTIKKANKIEYSIRVEGGNIDSKIHFTLSDTFDVIYGLYAKGSLNTNVTLMPKH